MISRDINEIRNFMDKNYIDVLSSISEFIGIDTPSYHDNSTIIFKKDQHKILVRFNGDYIYKFIHSYRGNKNILQMIVINNNYDVMLFNEKIIPYTTVTDENFLIVSMEYDLINSS
jgi:hypothetical protein